MSIFDFTAHKHLLNNPLNSVQSSIEKAIDKSHMGRFLVCSTTAGDVLVLPEYSASVRDDVTEVVYDTDLGYSITSNNGEAKWS
jgi:hypothetical protein